MGYECVVCMETLETPAPEAAIAVPQYFQENQKPGSSRQQMAKRSAEDTPEYRSNICSTSCGHIFHRACLNRWFHQKMKSECPSCRKLLTPAKICHIYPPSVSEDFLSYKTSQFAEIENHLPQCDCGSEECALLYQIHKTLANDHSKLLGLMQRFTDQVDDKSLLLARIASLEQECERLKEIPNGGGANEDTQPILNPPRTYNSTFESNFMNLFPPTAPSSSSSSSAASSDSETSPALYNSILTAIMSPSQLSRFYESDLRNTIAIPIPPPLVIRPSQATATSIINARRSFEYIGSLAAQINSNRNQQASETVTSAARSTIPERVESRRRNQTRNLNEPSSSTSTRNNASSTLGSSNSVHAVSETVTNDMFTRKPRISINLLSLSDATDIRNNLSAQTPRIPLTFTTYRSRSATTAPAPKTSSSKPPRQLAMKSTGRPPRVSQNFRCSTTIRASENARNNEEMPSTSKASKAKTVSRKSTAKPPRSAPTTSHPVASSSSRVPIQIKSYTPYASTLKANKVLHTPVPKNLIARKSTSKPPPPSSNNNRAKRAKYRSQYYYSSSSSSEEE